MAKWGKERDERKKEDEECINLLMNLKSKGSEMVTVWFTMEVNFGDERIYTPVELFIVHLYPVNTKRLGRFSLNLRVHLDQSCKFRSFYKIIF